VKVGAGDVLAHQEGAAGPLEDVFQLAEARLHTLRKQYELGQYYKLEQNWLSLQAFVFGSYLR
jgi:hypothetical protein